MSHARNQKIERGLVEVGTFCQNVLATITFTDSKPTWADESSVSHPFCKRKVLRGSGRRRRNEKDIARDERLPGAPGSGCGGRVRLSGTPSSELWLNYPSIKNLHGMVSQREGGCGGRAWRFSCRRKGIGLHETRGVERGRDLL